MTAKNKRIDVAIVKTMFMRSNQNVGSTPVGRSFVVSVS